MTIQHILSITKFSPAFRTIASCYPPIDLFEDIAPVEDWEFLIELEMATNPRIKQEVGDISLVPVSRRITGPGASIVMAAFTHFKKEGDRFTNGNYGAYYASDSLETSIAERVHILNNHLLASEHSPDDMQQRVYLGSIKGNMHTIEDINAPELHPNEYTESRQLALEIRNGGGDGIVYPSVRVKGGTNIVAFWPDVVAIPTQNKHLQFHSDGRCIIKCFDYSSDKWVELH